MMQFKETLMMKELIMSTKDDLQKINVDSKVNPNYYRNVGDIECIDAIEHATGSPEAFEGYLQGTAMKYLWRYKNKGKEIDLHKCKWFIEKLIEYYERKN